jgi:hypothetical protein
MVLVKEVWTGLHIYEEREVGIEIEMEGRDLIEQCPGWLVVRDGSLRGESQEYVLKAPVVRKDVTKLLSRLHKAFQYAESKPAPSDRCGVHVHINCQALTITQVYNFAILYLIFEDLLVKYCGESREGNLFCLRARDAEGLLVSLVHAAGNGELTSLQNDKYRYASLNFSSLCKYGTLEFRALQTPADVTEIKAWVELLLAIKDTALKYDSPVRIVEELSFLGVDAFIESTFGKLADLLPADGRYKSVYDGVRRVQDVAYGYKEASVKKAKPKLEALDIEVPIEDFADGVNPWKAIKVEAQPPMPKAIADIVNPPMFPKRKAVKDDGLAAARAAFEAMLQDR